MCECAWAGRQGGNLLRGEWYAGGTGAGAPAVVPAAAPAALAPAPPAGLSALPPLLATSF